MMLECPQSLLINAVHSEESFVIAALLSELVPQSGQMTARKFLTAYQVSAAANRMQYILRGRLARITFQEEVAT
jgi:hypothetical protein